MMTLVPLEVDSLDNETQGGTDGRNVFVHDFLNDRGLAGIVESALSNQPHQ
jgi:hypothetical protein